MRVYRLRRRRYAGLRSLTAATVSRLMGPRRLLAVSIALALSVTGLAAGAGGANGEGEFTFFPQAGILWQDLYPNNFVDLDPGPGIRDYRCGTQTYDGHTGTDSDIRSFREMDIGVRCSPRWTAASSRSQDGEYDRRYGPTAVAVRQPRRRRARDGPVHDLRPSPQGDRAEAERPRRRRAADRWTASSGNSSWPHLHFTSQVGGEIDEPFTGPCNEGPSGYTEQVSGSDRSRTSEISRSAARPSRECAICRSTWPCEPEPSCAGRAPSTRASSSRLRSIPIRGCFACGSSGRPARRSVGRRPSCGRPTGGATGRSRSRSRLGKIGRWRLVVDLDGNVLADAPFDVVERRAQVQEPAAQAGLRRALAGDAVADARRSVSRPDVARP